MCTLAIIIIHTSKPVQFNRLIARRGRRPRRRRRWRWRMRWWRRYYILRKCAMKADMIQSSASIIIHHSWPCSCSASSSASYDSILIISWNQPLMLANFKTHVSLEQTYRYALSCVCMWECSFANNTNNINNNNNIRWEITLPKFVLFHYVWSLL